MLKFINIKMSDILSNIILGYRDCRHSNIEYIFSSDLAAKIRNKIYMIFILIWLIKLKNIKIILVLMIFYHIRHSYRNFRSFKLKYFITPADINIKIGGFITYKSWFFKFSNNSFTILYYRRYNTINDFVSDSAAEIQ